MPEHTSFLTYLVHALPANVDHNFQGLKSFIAHQPVNRYALEPIFSSLTIVLVVVLFAVIVRTKISNTEQAVVPESRLSIRTLLEVIVEYFYKLLKDMMGGDTKRAKRYLPFIGTCACFIFFSNMSSLIPGWAPPTSNLNITLGCAIIVFITYHYYGFRENGVGYLKHFMGPVWWLAPLMFVIEILSHCIRPVTLAVRLMLNMAVDHLVLSIVLALLPLLVPLPLMLLGTLVAIVQTLVFCLLASIYVSMATEHEH